MGALFTDCLKDNGSTGHKAELYQDPINDQQ